MTFKYAQRSLIMIDASGVSLETDLFMTEFATVGDFVNWAEGYDLHEMLRILIIDPYKNKPYDSAQTVNDVTDEVFECWVQGINVLEWDEQYGKPEAFDDKTWDELVSEAQEDADDYRRMMRDPMAYHFGPNWHGVRSGRGY